MTPDPIAADPKDTTLAVAERMITANIRHLPVLHGDRPVGILSAVYDPVANTVTLVPQTRINLHYNYQLTVIGTGPKGITNNQGVRLDGANNGVPGSNYVGVLNWSNVVLTPAQLKKYGVPKPAGTH